jgi:hypothetical protein
MASRARFRAWPWLAAAATALAPLAATRFPPLHDYPNHLSRIALLARWDEMPELHAHFERGGLLVPNALSDLVGVGLASAVDPLLAGRLLLALILLLTLGGVAALNLALHRRPSAAPLAAALLLHNEVLAWGFLNYLLGVAIVPLALAAWVRLEGRGRPLRVAVGAGFALVLYLSHLVALGIYAVAVAAIETDAALRGRGLRAGLRRLALGAAQFAPVAALFLAGPARELAAPLLFNPWPGHKLPPFTRLLATGEPAWDGGVLLALAALALWAALRRELALDRRAGVAVAALLAAYWALPHSALGSYFLDGRMPIAIALLAVAGTAHRPRAGTWGAGTRAAAVAAGLLLTLAAARGAELSARWSDAGERYEEAWTAFGTLPRGGLLVPVVATPFEHAAGWFRTRDLEPPHAHTGAYATIARAALVPGIFARRGQNTLHLTTGAVAGAVAGFAVAHPFAHLDGPGALPAFLAEAATLARELGPGPAAHVVVFRIGCGEWPAGVPAKPRVCGRDFVLAELEGAEPEGVDP